MFLKYDEIGVWRAQGYNTVEKFINGFIFTGYFIISS